MVRIEINDDDYLVTLNLHLALQQFGGDQVIDEDAGRNRYSTS